MSRSNDDLAHGHFCRCWECASGILSSTGTWFGSDIPQQAVGSGNLTQPPPASRAQIEQSNKDIEALTNTLHFQTSRRIWDDPQCWRAVSREETLPLQYYYPMNIESDIPSTPSRQPQPTGPNPTNTTTVTQTNVLQPGARSLPRSNPPASQAGGRPQGQPRANLGSPLGYGMPSASSGRRSPTSATGRPSHTSRHGQRQVPSQLSRQSQSVAEDTPDSEESSGEGSE